MGAINGKKKICFVGFGIVVLIGLLAGATCVNSQETADNEKKELCRVF